MSNFAKNDMGASKAARDSTDFSGTKWFKPAVGANYIRILPPHNNMTDPATGAHRFFHPVCLHFGIGPAKKVVPCPRRMLERFCPICDVAFDLKNKGHERAGNDLLPSWQFYMNVIIFKEVKNKSGKVVGLAPTRTASGELEVYVWSASRGVVDDIFDEVEERQAKLGVSFLDITDVKEGLIVKVSRKGTGKEDTKYKVTLDTEPTDITDLVDEFDESMTDVTALSPVVALEDIKALMSGEDTDPFAEKALAGDSRSGVVSRFADDDEDIVEGEVVSSTPVDTGAGARRLAALIAEDEGDD